MRTYIQLNEQNIATAEVKNNGMPTSATILDVTGRVDGPWLGKVYDKQRDTFSDPPPVIDPRPVAEVVLYEPSDLTKTLKLVWNINEPIGIDVTIKDGDGKIVADFNGSFGIPIMSWDPILLRFTGGVRRLGLEFINGVASRTFRGFTASGDYGVDDRVSTLARVVEPLIISVFE